MSCPNAVAVSIMVGVLVATALAQNPAFNFVTCGSSIKLAHTKSGARLHSHEVKYGSNGGSSGQNSITGMNSQTDANSLWKVMGSSQSQEDCPSGKTIRCGTTIRLKHAITGCFLHSHANFQSPLSKQQEVSGLGCPSSPNHAHGDRDPGDDWNVVCGSSPEFWERNDFVALQHVATGKYLHHNMHSVYQNPIRGQREISAVGHNDENSKWVTQEGVFVKPKGTKSADGASSDHDEL